MPSGTKNRGFASMDAEKQKEIARKGGRAAHEKGTAHEFTAHEARAAGRKGGERVSANREHMSRIGRIGGKRSANRRQQDRVAVGAGASMHPGEAVASTEGRPAEHLQTESRPGQHRGEMASSGGHEAMHGMSHRGQADRANHDDNPDSGNGHDRGDLFGSHEQLRDEAEAAVPSR
jgi:general stress protein YciG